VAALKKPTAFPLPQRSSPHGIKKERMLTNKSLKKVSNPIQLALQIERVDSPEVTQKKTQTFTFNLLAINQEKLGGGPIEKSDEDYVKLKS
jgi:hypothetical protein